MLCDWCSCWVVWAVGLYIVYRIVDSLIRLPFLGKLDNKYVLITGCDSGFGFQCARRLDQMGVHVFAGCLTEKGETEVKKGSSERLVPVSLNVANQESVRKAYRVVQSKLPSDTGLWGVVNNAGIIGNLGPVQWLQLKDYEKVLSVNLLGLIDVTTVFMPLVKKARGRYVNTASMAGRFTISDIVPYCISKFGVETFSDGLRRQLRPYRCSVHIIEPGFYKTNITSENVLVGGLRASWEQTPQDIKDEYGEQYLNDAIEFTLKQQIPGFISEKTGDVVDAYCHALLGRCPRGRYVVGTDARFLWLNLARMPEWMVDKLLELMDPNRPIPAACK